MHAEVDRCPSSTSQLHFFRLFTQSRKLRACGYVSAKPDPFDTGSIAGFFEGP